MPAKPEGRALIATIYALRAPTGPASATRASGRTKVIGKGSRDAR